MELEWLLLAEGLGQDAKGAITAIGINQNVLAVPSLPATTKRAVITHVVDAQGSLKGGEKLGFRFRVTAPSGEIVNVQGGQITLGPKPHPDLPFTIDLPVEVILEVKEYGPYRLETSLEFPDDNQVAGEVILYVKKVSDNTSTPSDV